MSWGDGVPNPFDEAKDKLIVELNEKLGEADRVLDRYQGTLVNLKQRLQFIIYPGMPPNQKMAFEEMIDSIDRTMHP